MPNQHALGRGGLTWLAGRPETEQREGSVTGTRRGRTGTSIREYRRDAEASIETLAVLEELGEGGKTLNGPAAVSRLASRGRRESSGGGRSTPSCGGVFRGALGDNSAKPGLARLRKHARATRRSATAELLPVGHQWGIQHFSVAGIYYLPAHLDGDRSCLQRVEIKANCSHPM